MKIATIETWLESVDLTRPYAIASRSISTVELLFIRLGTDTGLTGLGSASPAEEVTGESLEACEAALDSANLDWLRGSDPRQLAALCRRLGSELGETPAARLAVETALHDIFARHLGIPLVDLFGRCHRSLPTSITIGIKETIEDALAEAREYVGRGFKSLKVKIGRRYEQDAELLAKLRQQVGTPIQIRVDANRGYSIEEATRFWSLAQSLELELVEQPVTVDSFAELRSLPIQYRQIIAADESLLSEQDALQLTPEPRPCGIFNIKLMKCGGLTAATSIARIAEASGFDLMWGCMDESVISISAALHTAFASPQTRYLDLDGSLDLASDPARGGFRLDSGEMTLADGIGLGVELA